jgi:predicted dehydrogenase
MSSTVRIGVIGVGNMGREHARYLAAGDVAGATLAAVADNASTSLDWAAKSLPESVQKFDNAEEMMKSGAVDAVIVAAPHYFHPPLAIAALNLGLHALVEKPAGVYVKQVREMNEVAAKSDRVFGIMFNQRTRPVHQKVRDVIASGELGEIRRTQYMITNWFRTQSYYDSGGWRATWEGEGGGVLVNQCPHNLDLWQWFCGMPTRVRAFCGFGRHHNIEVEDDVTAYVEYANGATGTFITTTGEAPGASWLEISGDRGRLRMEGNSITFWRTKESVSEFLRTSPNGFVQPETWRCEIPVGSSHDGNEHRVITRGWVAAIQEGKPLLAEGTEGINGVQLANAMLLSAWTDDWAAVPTDEDKFYELLQEKIRTSSVKKAVSEKTFDLSGTY